MKTIGDVNGDILLSIDDQISDLYLVPDNKASLAAVLKELNNLSGPPLKGIPDDKTGILDGTIKTIQAIYDGTTSWQDSGSVFGDLDTLKNLTANKPDDSRYLILTSVITQIKQLLAPRPDVSALMSDLTLMKDLRGGPADATAFHDFNVLQIAFENVWTHAFDRRLKNKVEDLYRNATNIMANSGIKNAGGKSLPLGDTEQLQDIEDLQNFLTTIEGIGNLQELDTVNYFGTGNSNPGNGTITQLLSSIYPQVGPIWNLLRDADRTFFNTLAQYTDSSKFWASNPSDNWQDQYAIFKGMVDKRLQEIIKSLPKQGEVAKGRLQNLIKEIGQALKEPYAFDVFTPYSYNFGIMLTYRQQWEPGEYQAGDLKATIPLAPGETRKYSKKTHVKTSRAVKEMEKSMSTRSSQSSIISRAEAEIMNKSTTNTNFKMTADASFNIGLVGIHATSEFGLNQEAQSSSNKKDFHEATLKSAEEYRLERSLEVDTATTYETEEMFSGEISNPNNEITVTYLFYELQRRFNITEHLYRARPAILVAQEVPSPEGIDEAWLVQYQWIISRVLLDDSLRPALIYLNSGFAGDELSLEVLKAQWENLATLTKNLEAQVSSQLAVRDYYRNQLVGETLQENLAKVADDNVGFFGKIAEKTLGDFTGAAVQTLDANRQYTESLLQNVNDNIADLQNKLKQATDGYGKATERYSSALQLQFNRHEIIDQLRVHVKQNIIYYMQAIWDHEPADQRYFRLYNLPIICPGDADLENNVKPSKTITIKGDVDKGIKDKKIDVYSINLPVPTLTSDTRLLKDIADLDNPLGYKGNYIIFPLKTPLWITTFMLQEYISDLYGVKDPDPNTLWPDAKSLEERGKMTADKINAEKNPAIQQQLAQEFVDYVNSTLNSTNMIIVPTGQLFIEALTGTHPVLEDFKLLHRAEDVRKVKAEVRHAELENLRLASRLVAAQNDPAKTNMRMLGDPDIEKVVVVEDPNNIIADAG